MAGITYDPEKLSINMVKLKKGGSNFEVAIDPDLAIEFKKGKQIEIREILKSENIFFDLNKGLIASEKAMKEIFGTEELLKIAEVIINTGDIQLTSDYRNKLREEKRKKIITLIQRNGIDPRTNLPHPLQRIENAFEEAKVKVDEIKNAEDQIQDILRKLMPILPIKFQKKKLKLHIPATSAGKCYSTLKSMSDMSEENWLNDGSFTAIVEIPAGLTEEFFDKINKVTHGDCEIKEVN
jgi:ribosome maturation protein SDO1